MESKMIRMESIRENKMQEERSNLDVGLVDTNGIFYVSLSFSLSLSLSRTICARTPGWVLPAIASFQIGSYENDDASANNSSSTITDH